MMLSELIAQILLRTRTITVKISSRSEEFSLALLAASQGRNLTNVSENFEVAVCHDNTVWHTTARVIAEQVKFNLRFTRL